MGTKLLSLLRIAVAISVPAPSFAYTLPPKVQDAKYSASAVNSLDSIKAREMRVIWKEPVFHGGVGFDSNRERILILSPEGSRVFEVPLNAKDPQTSQTLKAKTVKEDLRARLLKRSKDLGTFSIEEARLFYKPESNMPGPLWEIALGFLPLGIAQGPGGLLVGWGAYPAKLFMFAGDRRYFHRLEWAEDSEPVAFLPCGSRESWLLENLSSGRNRLVRFEETQPRAQLLFDLADNEGSSDASRLLSVNCESLVVAGSFGVAHLKFDRFEKKK